MSEARGILANLLETLGFMGEAWLDHITIAGTDPVVPSRYKPGLASAVSLGAYAAGIAEIWRLRGNPHQSAGIDLAKAAVPGLRTLSYVRRGRHALQLQRPESERQVFFETRDGRQMYLLRHAFYHEHFTRLLSCLDCSPDTRSIARAVSRFDALELEEKLAEARAMGALARTREEWLAHPQGRNLAGRTPVNVRRLLDSEPEPLGPAARPLSGIRVVDMGHVLAGPVVSRTLAEQGAEVIHVSPPHMPDPNHVIVDTTLGKRTAFADLRSGVDRAELLELIAGADVFVHSWRPGSLEAHGLSFDMLAERRPGLIYATVSCYGHDGPWADRAGYDPFGQVVTGLAVGEGSIDAPVLASTFTLNDYLAGYSAAAGVVSALAQRARTGGSYRVDVSLAGASMWLQDLGQLPVEQWPGAPGGVDLLPPIDPKDLQVINSPFGEIEHPRPIVAFSDTRSYWTTPPRPAGSDRLVWD